MLIFEHDASLAAWLLCLVLAALAGRLAQGGASARQRFLRVSEVKTSDLVFIGTVASIEPIFLNRWSGAQQAPMRSLNDAYLQAQEHPSAEALESLKEKYLATFPVLDDREKKLVQSADSVQQMVSFLDYSLDRGMRVHLKVRTLFKQGDDDDKASPKKQKKAPDFLDVWTASGDCGYDFQVGETYLVYANDEEGADYFFTSTCMRTKRLSDAGDDLAYLYFYKDQPESSARLEGFATSDRKSQLAISPMHDPAAIGSPSHRRHFQIAVECIDSLRRIGQQWQVCFRRFA